MEEVSRRELLRIARESIAAHQERRVASGDRPSDPDLLQCDGCFVTLKIGGALRGCIGRLQSDGPLHETIAEMAVAAASEDPRFPQLSRSELDRVHIEISVLGEFLRVSQPSEIEVGRDGLYIRRGAASGLLLPQVAVEYGWDVETFLAHTCDKAGLPAESWRDARTEIHRFSAEVFGEEE